MLLQTQVEGFHHGMLPSASQESQHTYAEPNYIHFVFQYSNDVLNTFTSFKLDGSLGQKSSDDAREKQVFSDEFFPKFLTHQNLLQLQLSDSNFRRYILIQYMVLFQYLKSAVKFKG